MGKVDINKINKTTDNSTKIEQSKQEEQTKAHNEVDELTDNTQEKTEDTNEIKQEEKAKEQEQGEEDKNNNKNSSKVVVTYVGSGVWKDSDGKLWASSDKSDNILSERQFTSDEYEKREDIKFMVGYGAMKAVHVK